MRLWKWLNENDAYPRWVWLMLIVPMFLRFLFGVTDILSVVKLVFGK